MTIQVFGITFNNIQALLMEENHDQIRQREQDVVHINIFQRSEWKGHEHHFCRPPECKKNVTSYPIPVPKISIFE
jgi:hypothetical protein